MQNINKYYASRRYQHTVQLKKKLLVVSHSCVNSLNQLLFTSLVEQYPDIDLTLLVPSNWRHEYTGGLWDVKPHPSFHGKFRMLPVVFSGNISLHFYSYGVVKLLQEEQPDWIYVEEEPWAAVTQQFARCNKAIGNAPFIFHYNQNIYKNYPWPFSYMERWIFRNASHALPVGETSASNLHKKGYGNPLTIFPYFVDASLYYPKPEADIFRETHGANRESFIFGYLGRFVEEKGLISLIRAFKQVHLKYPETTMLWLVGDGPEKENLVKLASELELYSPTFKIIPSVIHSQAPEVLSAFNTLVLPSLTRKFWKEQFGRVIIESLACKTPVIGSDSGEIPYLIKKLNGGLVFKEGNIEDLTGKMIEILVKKEQAKKFIEEGQANVLTYYTHDHLARVLHKVLQSL